MNEEMFELTKNEMSRDVLEQIVGFDASCKERCEAEVVDSPVIWLA